MFSSALAFSALLTMIPLLLLSASAVGILLSSSEMAVQQMNAVLDTMFPPQPFASNIKDSILFLVSDLIRYRASLCVVGVVVLLVTATFVFDIVRTILHKVYGLKRKRNVLVSFLHDVFFVFVAFILLIATHLAIWTVSIVAEMMSDIPALNGLALSEIGRAVPTGIVFLVTAVMFYIIYGHITDTKPPRAAAMVSTITMTVLWVISGKLFSLYLSGFSAIGTPNRGSFTDRANCSMSQSSRSLRLMKPGPATSGAWQKSSTSRASTISAASSRGCRPRRLPRGMAKLA